MSVDTSILEQTIIYGKLDEIHDLCRKYNVQRLDLFGSALLDDFAPERSDLDFLVLCKPQTPQAHYENSFGLWFALEDMFGRSVDLIEQQRVKNPYIAQAIHASRVAVYEAT
jgi:uncharacterized protein